MFSFFEKKNYIADILDGMYDIHCHLLPGVDDGSPNAEHSAVLLKRLEDLGIRGMYLTPHIINGAYHGLGEEELRAEFASFNYDGNLDIRLAAEYFIDDRFQEHMAGSPLAMGGNNILAEFSMSGYSLHAFDILFEATIAGLEIIIAHPERYYFVQERGRDKIIKLLLQHQLQLNLLSLTGFHGNAAKKCAERLLEEGRYSFVGTDTHSNTYIDAMQKSTVSKKIFDKVNALKDNNMSLFL